ncbi:ATP-binding cassette transporter snq2 [Tilletia horrida]|uniref:ATP-binding cassette transporter snq2 n=1 Tax=Tilletia horrida TaxID=155126 RepID=A0AAN6GFE5_9BASI|nr:ATP-binding cassette transporter snq2 [Tilletia horrida]
MSAPHEGPPTYSPPSPSTTQDGPSSSQDVASPPSQKHEPAQTGINVESALTQFTELSRRLTQQGQNADQDIEKNVPFDLFDFLRGVGEEAESVGIKPKLVGVTWNNLAVRGVAASTLKIPTIPDMFKEVVVAPFVALAKRLRTARDGNSSRYLLQGFSGVAKPYQMTLVIGRPGSGCSTFLKLIANQRQGYLGVEGDVKYAGLDAKDFAKHYPGELCYSAEDDIHYDTLTVKQTLDFALSLKVPGTRLPRWADPKTFRAEVLKTLLSALNISHTANTKVGGPHIRGVSGGERKRVSIAEMFATRAAVLSWDNSTRGLDASTALDFAKSLRICCDLLDLTLFASFYQAGEGIYDLFDKVLVVDSGRCVYYGPTTEARGYMLSLGFEDLPRQTTADYLSGCTDPNERRLTESGYRFSTSNPPTPQTLEQAYKESDIYKREMQAKAEYEAELNQTKAVDVFRQAVRQDKNKGVRPQSRYTVSYFSQIWRLIIRQIQILSGDWFDIAFGLFASVVLGCVTGSTFKSLPETAEGGFTRGGVLFLTLLFNALVAFTELPTQMGQKPILYKHQSYCFFRPSALSVAQLFADIPFSFPRVLLFVICAYFIAGLRGDAGAFFTFFLIVYTLFLTLVCCFKIFAAICKTYDVAARMATLTIVAMVLFAGYMQPRDQMKRFLFWITYINPVYWAFEAAMINEFKGLNLQCTGHYITPRGPGFQDAVGPFQTCTLPGAVPGQQFVRGVDYIQAAFGFPSGDLWKCVGICLGYFVGTVIIGALAVEILDQDQAVTSFSVSKKPNKEEAELNRRLHDRSANGQTDSEKAIDVRSQPFTWESLTYTVPVKGGTRQLLDHIDGFCEPGTLTALMGASGAGKTTLLDVLANRKSIGVISGERLISGQPIDGSFQRGCGYAEQQDIHEGTSTVREALRFSAYLRQDAQVSKEEKDAYVEDIIELLEMQDIADAMVGTPEGLGLDVGDRKRLTIGVELAAKPDLLLFLDEPTSGLDGQTAYNVVRFLKKLAAAGQAILCTIHQPNSLLFENFDRLLLLQRGGSCVYFGPVGNDSVHIRQYFAERGADCPDNVNPAEFMLDAVGAGLRPRIGDRDWAELYKESELYQENLRKIAEIKERCKNKGVDIKVKSSEYASSFWTQVAQVGRRALVSSWRQPDYQFTRLFEHASIALLTGLLFLRLDPNVAGIQARIFGIFMLTVVPATILIQTEPYFMVQRGIYNREQSSKMYSGIVFAIGQMAAELPFSIVCAIVYFVLFYYISGFQSDSGKAGYFFAFMLLNEVFSVTLAQCVAALSPDLYTASLANPFILLIFDLFCGVTVPKPNIPEFWRSWLYHLNPFTRLIGGLVINEMEGLSINCAPSELALFNPPTGQTCAAYASSFVNSAFGGGYLSNPNATQQCAYCPYARGDEFLVGLGLGHTKGREIGIFAAFCVSNIIILLLACRFIRYANR